MKNVPRFILSRHPGVSEIVKFCTIKKQLLLYIEDNKSYDNFLQDFFFLSSDYYM